MALADGQRIEGRFVVAADGAKSTLRRLMLPKEKPLYAFALEGHVDLPKDYPMARFEIDFFQLKNGYGWVFPKGNHLNVGVGVFCGHGELSREALRDYCREKLGHDDLTGVVGYPLGQGGYGQTIYKDRVLFVGDAVGGVESLLGEGIHNAVASGQAAAAAILAADGDGKVCAKAYKKAFAPIKTDLLACRNLSWLFYRFPWVMYGLLALDYSKNLLADGFAKGQTMAVIGQRALGVWRG